MKQASIKLKTHVSNISIINNNNVERLILNIMIFSFCALALLYVLFLGNMVFNIVERRNLEQSSRALSNEVGDLELSYLSMSSELTPALSFSLGLIDIKPTFATRTASLGLVSKVNGNEI